MFICLCQWCRPTFNHIFLEYFIECYVLNRNCLKKTSHCFVSNQLTRSFNNFPQELLSSFKKKKNYSKNFPFKENWNQFSKINFIPYLIFFRQFRSIQIPVSIFQSTKQHVATIIHSNCITKITNTSSYRYSSLSWRIRKKKKEKFSVVKLVCMYLIYDLWDGYGRNECVILVVEDDEGDEEGRTHVYCGEVHSSST